VSFSHRLVVSTIGSGDHAACRRVAVDLGEHIAEEVAQREDDDARWHGKAEGQREEFDGDDVRDDEPGDEESGHDDEAPRVPHPINSNASSISSSVIVSGGVALM